MCLIYYFIAGIKIHLEQSKQKVELVALEQMADVLGIRDLLGQPSLVLSYCTGKYMDLTVYEQFKKFQNV